MIATRPNGEKLVEIKNVVHVSRGSSKRLILWHFDYLCNKITLQETGDYILHFGMVTVCSTTDKDGNAVFDLGPTATAENKELEYIKQITKTWRFEFPQTRDYIDFNRIDVVWIEKLDVEADFTKSFYTLKIDYMSNNWEHKTTVINASICQRLIPLAHPISKIHLPEQKNGSIKLCKDIVIPFRGGSIDFSTFDHPLKEQTHKNVLLGSRFDYFEGAEGNKNRTVDFSRLKTVLFLEEPGEKYADELPIFYTQYNVKLPDGTYKYLS